MIRYILAAALTVTAGVALAQSVGDPTAGRTFAMKNCSGCHVVTARQPGPNPDAVPSFESIANSSAGNQARLRVFLLTPHGQMPDLYLSRSEIDNVGAYILTLRRGK
jgi:mono/diheme cytochrome c family protein